MLTSFTVHHFRGLSDVTVEPLGRINLITGKNNTGKTALLEAIFLHCQSNDPSAAVRVNEYRGLRLPTTPAEPTEETCGWLFSGKETAQPIELIGTDEAGTKRTQSIFLIHPGNEIAGYPDALAVNAKALPQRPEVLASASFALVERFRDSDGHEATSVGFPIPSSLAFAFLGAETNWHPPIRFLSFGQTMLDKENELFSEIEASNRQGEVLTRLRILEPQLRRLSLLIFAGNPMIHCDIGLSRLVPVSFLGEGFRRLFAILLAIANARGGVVLIDEIDTGLHHSVIQRVFETIGLAARDANVQVFATTHSYECIMAAHRAFSENGSYDLRLHRLDRAGDRIRAVTYDQESLETSLDLSWEIR